MSDFASAKKLKFTCISTLVACKGWCNGEKEVSLDHFHMLHEDHTYATIKVMKRKMTC